MKIIITLFIFLLIITGCYSSGIFYDEYESAATSAILVVKENTSISSPWVRNFSIPKIITSYLLTEFTHSNGTINMDNIYVYSNAYRGNKILDNVNGFNIYEIPFTEEYINTLKEQTFSNIKLIQVTFSIADLVNNNNELIYQPGNFAAMLGIKDSYRPSGEVCLLDLIYSGNGEFQADVCIK